MRRSPHRTSGIVLSAVVFAMLLGPARVLAQTDEGSAYSDFLVGSYLLEGGKPEEAVDYFERAWRASDHDDAIGLKLAEAYYLLKNFTRCEMVVDDVLEDQPVDRDAQLMKAKVRYLQRDSRGAIEHLNIIRDNYPVSFEVERLLGNIHYEMGDVDEALEAYKRCLAIDSSYPYIQYRYGRLLVIAERYDEAEAAFRAASELDPSFVEPTLALIDLLIDQGKTSDALPLLEGVVQRDPRNERAMTTLAGVYLDTGRYDDGIALIERWQEHSELSHEAEVLLGRLRYEAGDYDGAFKVFDKMFDANPKSSELARILAETRLGKGDFDGARRYFRRAIEIGPEDYRNYLAMFFASTPKPAPAEGEKDEPVLPMDDADRAALLDSAATCVASDDFDGTYLLGVSFQSIDRLDAAERCLLVARQLKPDDFRTLFNLATIYEKQRRYENAESCLETMLEMRPDDPTTLNFYGYLLSLMQKDLPRALDMLEKALEAEPDNGYFLDSYGWIYYQMGDYARAVVELEKASSIVKEDPVILEHLGDAYAAMKRFDEARAAYMRSQAIQGGDEILEKIESTRRHN